MAKLPSFWYDHLRFPRVQMRVLKSACRYFKINTITVWHILTKFTTFIPYFLVSSSTAWNVIIFNNGEVFEVSAWPSINFCVTRNVCAENIPLCKNYLVPNDINKTSHSAFTANAQFIFSWLQPKSSVALENLPAACASFSLSMKRRADMLVCFIHVQTLLFLLLPANY